MLFRSRVFTRPRAVTIAGLLLGIRKKGNRVILTLDDNTGRMEVVFFEDGFVKYKGVALKDRILVVEGNCGYDEFNRAWRINKVKDMYELDALRERRLARIDLTLERESLSPDFIQRLEAVLKPARGGRVAVNIKVRFQHQGQEFVVPIPQLENWRVRPSETLVRALENLAGPGQFSLQYSSRAVSAQPEPAYA